MRPARLAALALVALAPAAAAATPPKAAPAKPGTTAKAAPKGASKGAPAAYRNQVGTWHAGPPDPSPPLDGRGRPKLVLRALNTGERVELEALGDDGGFHASTLDRAARTLRDPRTGAEHPIEPRLLDVVYHLQRHFGAEELRVVSAFRAPTKKSRSNHGRGRAIDLIVPGARDEDVARFARGLGFCGVGIYPASGFVHVDVRERSFYWVDASGPGKRGRVRGILPELAARADDGAKARGRAGLAGISVRGDVDALLEPLGLAGARAAEPEGDDTEDHEAEGGEP